MSCGSYYGPMLASRYPCRMAAFLGKRRWAIVEMGHFILFILLYSTVLYSTPLHCIPFLFFAIQSQGEVQSDSRSQSGQIISPDSFAARV